MYMKPHVHVHQGSLAVLKGVGCRGRNSKGSKVNEEDLGPSPALGKPPSVPRTQVLICLDARCTRSVLKVLC